MKATRMKYFPFLIVLLLPFMCSAQHKKWSELNSEADSLLQIAKVTKAYAVYEQALEAAKKEFGEESEEYLISRNGVGRTYIYLKTKEETESYLTENIQICKKRGEKSVVLAQALHNLGSFYLPDLKGNEPTKSMKYLEECLAMRKEVLGEFHPDCASTNSNLALLHRDLFNYSKAESLYKETLEIYKKAYGEDNLYYAHALNNLGSMYKEMGNLSLIEPLYLQCLHIYKKVLGEKHSYYASTLQNLGNLYKAKGVYSEAEIMHKEVLKIRKELFGVKHPEYASSLNNIANLYSSIGRFAEAEQIYLECLEIYKEANGEKHSNYANALSNLALLFYTMGNYPAAEVLFKKCLYIRKEVLGENHPEYATSLLNLASLYLVMGNYTASKPLYMESLRIRKEVFGKNHPDYASSVINLAILNHKMGRFHDADSLYKEGIYFRKEIFGEKHPNYALSLNNYANLHTAMGHYSFADSIFEKSTAILKEVLGETHPDYILVLNSKANLYWLNFEKERTFIEKTRIKNWCFEQTDLHFPTLSEVQRENFYNEKIKSYIDQFNSFSVEMPEINTEELYNVQLSSKAILMQASQKMKTRILNSGDSTLIAKYWLWITQKQQIIKAQELGSNALMNTALNLDSLQATNVSLEKEISLQSESFASLADKSHKKWTDIQAKLKKTEAAIEIVRIKKYGNIETVIDSSEVSLPPNFPMYNRDGLTDTIYYAALIIRKKSRRPELVLMKNGAEMEGKLVRYHKNTISYKLEDAHSYKEFWKPIASKLKGIKRVYFSPDGVYNQISLNTLYNTESKKYLLDEIEIHQVTNTKDILGFGKNQNKDLRAELLGYPKYDLESKNNQRENESKVEEDTTRGFANFQTVSALPGTLKEVEDISKILTENAYTLEVLLEENATEENIKKVKSPKILHLSTHGFFMDSKDKNSKLDPMLRSGLLLTGVSDYTRAVIKPETEDGILTAMEAANLELDDTDLVILSACETGLGDIKAGEGVYGLQRAFKVAGAKTLVMSMWKVDDTVTQKLMTSFYRKFAVYNNARKAFWEAQQEIKAIYTEPYYWGAFLMVGE